MSIDEQNTVVPQEEVVCWSSDCILKRIVKEETREVIINKMIEMMGASLAMMEYLVGIDSRDYRYRRRELNLSDTVDVQPMFISEDQTLQVYQSWRDHADEPDELKRYYIIGLETGIPLSQIWTHIMVAIDSVGTKISNQSGGG